MKNQESKKAVISVNNVSKNFKLPHDRKNSLKQHFVGLFKGKSNYEKFEALKNINFTVNEGDFFGIVGRNGSGKSTLLKIISGIYQPSSGSVKINGTLTPFIELGIGFNPELTGRENVYLNGSILGLTKKEIDNLYDEIVEFAELERFMDQKLKNYSSGMQVRLAFSIAIRAQNDILLLDEVLAVGDINFQKKCFNYFQKLKAEKKTVIFVTHDMNAVREYCNRAVLINNSKVIPTKDINDVLEKYIEIMNPGSPVQPDRKSAPKPKNRFKILSPKIIIKDEYIDISYTLEVSDSRSIDLKNIYTAFSLKDNIGNRLFGNSTKNYEKVIDLSMDSKNSRVTVSWRASNILSNGKYSINIAVFDALDNRSTFEDILRFNVKSKSDNSFGIDPLLSLELVNEK